jgi:hypothetical protein
VGGGSERKGQEKESEDFHKGNLTSMPEFLKPEAISEGGGGNGLERLIAPSA